MDAEQIRGLEPLLRAYLARFDDCFSRSDTRAHLPRYVRGQLSDLPRKSVEPIALQAEVPVRTLQEFLAQYLWDHGKLRDRLQQIVATEHASPESIGLIDETSCAKKGDKTPGVQRQYCGSTGKQDNCVVTVHLGYAIGAFHALLDNELYLPESWDQDRERCRAAGIPDDMHYRPKWRIALELYDGARANGVDFAWMTFDEGYGGKPEFLRELDSRRQKYVAEVPKTFTGWMKKPSVADRAFRRGGRGRSRRTPRLAAGARKAKSVFYHRQWDVKFKNVPWVRFRVKDTTQGPQVWEVKHGRMWPKDARGLPGRPLHLIVARNVLEPGVEKYFLSNAPTKTPLETILRVAFGRWPVERCFQDQKTELGFDHFEGRSYVGLKRHQAITAVTHLLLSRVCQAEREKKNGTDCLPGANGLVCLGPVLGADAAGRDTDAGTHGQHDQLPSTPRRHRSTRARPSHSSAASSARHPTHKPPRLPVRHQLAL